MCRENTCFYDKVYELTESLFIICREHLVTLGGTSQKGNESVQINADDKAGILERCKKILPRLQVRES